MARLSQLAQSQIAVHKFVRIANELKDFIMSLECQGEWCGKSPNSFNNYDGRCDVCKKQEELRSTGANFSNVE